MKRKALCRVDGCNDAVDPKRENARFCTGHLDKIPAPFVRRWESTSDPKALERLWEQIADDFVFEGATHVQR